MRPRSIRTLAVAVAFAVVPARAQDAEGLRLRIEKQLHMAPTRPERDSAKFIEADHLEGSQDKNIVATGNVTMRQRGASIRADRVDYFGEDQTAVATGHVRLEREGDIVSGPTLTYHLDKETGEMDSPTFELPKKAERRVASRGHAESAFLEPGQKSRLIRAEYTSCVAPRDDWFLRVGEIDIDGSRNVALATNTTVFFLGVPILYSPYLSFPLDNKRRSGFLAPTFGTSASSGFEASLPYYWNIAPNMDATLTPKTFTKRGLQLGAELRYLEPKFGGQFDGEYLPNDRARNLDRYFLGWRHTQQLWSGWVASINAQKVSDDDYFRDLTTKIALTSQTNLPRDARVDYNDDTWSATARVLGYQTLQDPLRQVPIPYNILPQLLFSGARQNVYGGFDWQLASELSNFRHPVLPNGQRLIVYPSITYPMQASYGYVIPKLGYHFTRYNMNENSTGLESASRALPVTSLDAGLFFERPMTWGSRAFLQTLEPRLFYLYVPFRDQSNLPNFTTAETDFNFQRMFAENRFVGGDRIGDANQITLALTTRFTESSSGLERLKAGLGQVYYFKPPQVTLSGPPADNKYSDILGFASSQMSPSVSVEAGWQYTPNLSRSEKIVVAARYSPEPGSLVNASYRYARRTVNPLDPTFTGIQQVDISTQWPVLRNVSALARWNWSIQDRKVLEGLVGFEYNAGCWQVRAVAHRFITATQTYSTSFQIQLELSGLTRIGINPLETIRQNITGYRRSDEISP